MTTTKNSTPTTTTGRPSEAAIRASFDLMHLVKERDELDERITAGVEAIRAAGGSWTTVGIALGVTAQAAHKRYARA